MTDAENIRFKIVYTLVKNRKPMKLSEIAKEAGLLDHHVLYHLKSLKKCFAIIEIEDKEYVCQPFLTDDSIFEDLKSLMSVIVKMISREMELPEDCTDNERIISVIRNLEIFIRSYSAEFFQ